jgi:hypothetical protein
MKTVYLNLEDDVAKAASKVKALKGEDVVLVIPKDSYLLGDSINLRLLKKQVDMLKNKVYILTMDPTGQMYAREAGFPLKRLPRIAPSSSFSDIRQSRIAPAAVDPEPIDEISKPVLPKRKLSVVKRKATRPISPVIETSRILRQRGQVTPEPVKTPKSKLQNNFFIPPESNRKGNLVSLPNRRSYKKYVIGFLAICFAVLILLTTLILPSGQVTIYAKSQPVSRDLDLTINANTQQIDSRLLTLPATPVSETKTVSKIASVNGKKEVGAKAQGRVALYNLTGSPLNLRATTTVLTAGSKSYYFASDQNGIVALEGPNNDSNATVADITAGDSGEDFNLPAGTRLEITNQSFGSQPQRLYAKTITQVIGGSSRFVSEVSKEDLDNAQRELVRQAVEEINNGLQDGRKLIEGTYTVEVQSFASDKPEKTEATNFKADATVKITGLAFNQDDLKSIVRGRLQQSLGSDKVLQDVSLDTIVNQLKSSDFAVGIAQLVVHYESKALPVIDEANIVTQLTGKSKPEAEDILLTNPDIEKVDISLAPSWQSTFPRLGSKIHVEVKK